MKGVMQTNDMQPFVEENVVFEARFRQRNVKSSVPKTQFENVRVHMFKHTELFSHTISEMLSAIS